MGTTNAVAVIAIPTSIAEKLDGSDDPDASKIEWRQNKTIVEPTSWLNINITKVIHTILRFFWSNKSLYDPFCDVDLSMYACK